MEGMSGSIDRRRFVQGGIAGIGMLGLGLAGCSASAQDDGSSAEPSGSDAASYDIAETKDVDVCIVGAGMSGLAAAMEAGDRGLSCVVLEKQDAPGGNGPLTSGIFGYNTALQREQGIEIDLGEMVQTEQRICSYRNDPAFFTDMALASAENIEWLQSHGIEFSGVVDGYLVGSHARLTQHWWAEDGSSYVDPAVSEAQRLGVEILLNTSAVDVVMDGAAVAGVVAQDADGNYLQVNAKAVIIATGGWLNNAEKMAELGYAEDRIWVDCMPGHDGDGLKLAVAAGCPDLSLQACYVGNACLSDLGFPAPTDDLVINGKTLWVNELGERFVNESVGAEVPAFSSNAVAAQKDAFVVFDQTLADTIGQDIIDEVMGSNAQNDKWIEESLDALADDMGVDADALAETVARYNELAAAGADADFGKDASCLVSIERAPFYGARIIFDYLASVGGIHTNRNMQAVDLMGNPIEGLYAIGVDGCELYKETYTINLPASANGNNINSGRTAVRHIAENL